ncbi:hypothetical protein [Pantoea anthophila]|uniref:hypothetical protein n=1 Tax=Pantoea anthophila TaxID=470931 RepID=UPI0006150B33|nr:hypothetical protein [Pantoea anthophila]KKB02713.1 hypothetical protein TN98_20970 [Pantoea anthophila]
MFDFNNFPPQFLHTDVSLTLSIIDSFINQTEVSIAESVEKFYQNSPEEIELDFRDDEGNFISIDYYMGLDSSSVDLHDMFTSYYPSITRRSVFLTLYGMLEHDFEKLCNGFANHHGAPVKLSELKGNGFERCDLFTRKIIGMPTSEHFSLVKKVTKLRNACAHNDARFVENDGRPIRELEELMRLHPEVLVCDQKQVNFKEGSLQTLTAILKNYFNDVEKALKALKKPDPFIAFHK